MRPLTDAALTLADTGAARVERHGLPEALRLQVGALLPSGWSPTVALPGPAPTATPRALLAPSHSIRRHRAAGRKNHANA